MHEMAICRLILEALEEEYGRIDPPPAGLKKVRVVAGRLHQIVPDFLESAYAALTGDTIFRGSEIELVFIPVIGKCNRCDWEGEIEPPFFLCGSCGAPGVERTAGTEFYLDKLEILQNGNA